MANRPFTRRMTPVTAEPMEWLVIIGDDCSRMEWVKCFIPDETYVRRLLGIPPNIPILVGRE